MYDQPAAKEITNYKSAFSIYAGIKDERCFFLFPRFQFFFSKLLKICEQSSVRDSSEKVSLGVSVIKICMYGRLVAVNLKFIKQ